MPSLIEKLDSLASSTKHVTATYNQSTGKIEYTVVPDMRTGRKSTAQKSISYSGDGWLPYANTASRDFRADDYGAAQAVVAVTELQRAIKFWQQWLGGLTWHIYDGASDETLVSSTDRKPKPGAGAMWYGAVKRFSRQWKHGLFESIAYSDWVHAETYIYKARNQVQATDFMWLNPVVTEPDIRQGRIHGYWYQSDDPETPFTLAARDVAYRIAQRNPLDDWRGSSPVLTALNDVNIVENVKRSLLAYYRNHMQLGGVVSGKPNEAGFSIEGTTVKEVREQMEREHKGARSAFNWFFSNAPIQIDQFQPLDIEKNYAIVEPIRKQIAMALGVPPVLSGDPTEVNYDNADKVMRNWWQTDGIPYASQVADFVNEDLLPAIEPGNDIYFGFDFTDFEIEDPETVSTDFTAQIIPINIAQKKRGYEVDEALKDVYMVNGVPMHRDLIVQKSREGLQADKKPNATQPDSDVAIPTAEIFGYHIDAGIVDVNEARAQLGLPPKKEAQVNELQDLQAKLSVMVTAYNAGIPTEVSAQMVGLSLPATVTPATTQPSATPPASEPVAEAPDDFTQAGKSIDIGDDHHAHLEPFAPKHTSYDDEFQAWKRFVFKGKSNRSFEPHWLRGDIGDGLQDAILLAHGDKDLIAKAFTAAQEQINATFKALSATRVNFEEDFNALIKKAMAGNNFGRVQWSSAMRTIIRRYGRLAYADGLIEGGVLDGGLSEEDENEVATLIASQSSYVSNLGAALYRDETVSSAMADQKAELWFNRSLKPFYEAGLLSADGNGVYEFGGKDGRESCSTCVHLKGQRHRLKTWARRGLRPGTDADSFECGGWHCEHKLIKVFARERGNWLA